MEEVDKKELSERISVRNSLHLRSNGQRKERQIREEVKLTNGRILSKARLQLEDNQREPIISSITNPTYRARTETPFCFMTGQAFLER